MSMNIEQRVMSQLMFKTRIYQKNASEFETFFTAVMSKVDKDFTQVKPQGQKGDRKNDGYNPKKGIYYQVYAPERVNTKEALEKMEGDLEGLFEFWDDICPVKEYNFLINDKYLGVYPDINSKIIELGNRYKIKTNLLLAKDLENMYMKLEYEEMVEIVGIICVPEAKGISFIDLNEIIEYIMNMDYNIEEEGIISPAEMEEKIIFNNLNKEISNIINTYSIYTGQLEEFFSNRGDFEREKIQEKLIQIYKETKVQIKDDIEDCSSLRFLAIVDKILPQPRKFSTLQALYVLLSYYFETCDILENPNKKEKSYNVNAKKAH